MPKTPEQRAADTAMDEAIMQCVKAYGCLEPGANVVSWIAVVEGQRWEDDDMIESWGIVYPNGQARSSVAIGLLTIGADLVNGGEHVTFPEVDDE